MREVRLAVNLSDGKVIHFIESRTDVITRRYDGELATFTVRVGDYQLDQLRALGSGLKVINGGVEDPV